MDSNPAVPAEAVPSILITGTTDPEQPEITEAPEPQTQRRQRQRRTQRRTTNPVHQHHIQPKKTFVDELGDAMVEHLCTTAKLNAAKLDDEPPASNTSVVDHLRSNLLATFIASSGADSRCSSRTLEYTLNTNLEDRNPDKLIVPSTVPALTSPLVPSDQSLRTTSTTEEKANVFRLDEMSKNTTILRLVIQYGKVAHMGLLDRSYRLFANKTQTAALSFKVRSGVAVVGGDPLCGTDMIPELLAEFKAYRRKHHWSIAFMGVSVSFARDYAQARKWTTIRFGTLRVLDPQTNEVLHQQTGRQIVNKCRQLIDPHKGNIKLEVYAPTLHGTDSELESDLIAIYDGWRAKRNNSAVPQTFISVYDPFAIPELMTFVFTCDSDGKPNGFAALRRLGNGGYYVDPCIAAPDSPKGISDLLIMAVMALLHRADVTYLGFGFEPSHALAMKDITGMPGTIATLTREMYGHAFQRLPLGGKKAYHDKFRPDPAQDSGLYLVFPQSVPSPRHLMGMLHLANISVRKILVADLKALGAKFKARCGRGGGGAVEVASGVKD